MAKKIRIKGRSSMMGKKPRHASEPTPEFKQKFRTKTETLKNGSKRTWVLDQCPIDWYQKKGWITGDQWTAGDTYFKVFEIARQINGFPTGGINPDFVPKMDGGKGSNPTDHQLDEYQKLLNMHKAVSRISRDMLYCICGECWQVGEYERMTRPEAGKKPWRKGYGMVRLQETLDELYEFLTTKKR